MDSFRGHGYCVLFVVLLCATSAMSMDGCQRRSVLGYQYARLRNSELDAEVSTTVKPDASVSVRKGNHNLSDMIHGIEDVKIKRSEVRQTISREYIQGGDIQNEALRNDRPIKIIPEPQGKCYSNYEFVVDIISEGDDHVHLAIEPIEPVFHPLTLNKHHLPLLGRMADKGTTIARDIFAKHLMKKGEKVDPSDIKVNHFFILPVSAEESIDLDKRRPLMEVFVGTEPKNVFHESWMFFEKLELVNGIATEQFVVGERSDSTTDIFKNTAFCASPKRADTE